MQPTRVEPSRAYDFPPLKMSQVHEFVAYLLHPESGHMALILQDIHALAASDGHAELLAPYITHMQFHLARIHERAAIIDLNVSWGAPISGLVTACGVLSETLSLVDHMFLENYNTLIKNGVLTEQEVADAKILFTSLLRVQGTISAYINGANWLGIGAMPIADLTNPACEQVIQMKEEHGIDLHQSYRAFMSSKGASYQPAAREVMADSNAVHLLIANFQSMMAGVAQTMENFEIDYVALSLANGTLRGIIQSSVASLGEHVVPRMPQIHQRPTLQLSGKAEAELSASSADEGWTMLTPAYQSGRQKSSSPLLGLDRATAPKDDPARLKSLEWK